MAEKEKLLKDTKFLVRSVLLPSPDGIMLTKFPNEYYKFVGSNIPFKDLGFLSFETFLRSIPDVVSMSYHSRLNDTILKAVCNDETKHVAKMVSKQKVSKQNKLSVPTKRRSQSFMPRGMPFMQRSMPFMPGCRPAPKPQLSASIKQDVLGVVNKHTNGIGLNDFQRSYSASFGSKETTNSSSKPNILSSSKPHEVDAQARCVLLPTPQISGTLIKPQSNNLSQPQVTPANRIPIQTSNITAPQPPASTIQIPNKPAVDYSFIASQQKPYLTPEIEKDLREVLRLNPHGIWLGDFVESYELLTRNKLELKEFGFTSFLQLVNLTPGIFKIRNFQNNKLLFDALSSTFSQNFSSQSGNEIISSIAQLVSNVRKLLQTKPDGIALDDFAQTFYTIYAKRLLAEDYGFKNLEALFSQISQMVPLKLASSGNEKIVKLGREISIHLAKIHSLKAGLQIPPDVIDSTRFEYQNLPDRSESNIYIPVRIVTIVDPSDFTIQLVGKDTSDLLCDLMDNLDDFYSGQLGRFYTMQEHHIIVGAIGATVWSGDGSWHRISITKVAADSVAVFFVDYGTFGEAQKCNLRYLRKTFMKLPAQAIRSQLAFIEPKHGATWDPASRTRFSNLCIDKVMMAQVVSMPQSRRVQLSLCDVKSSSYEIHINKLLVNEGHAIFVSGGSSHKSGDSSPKSINLNINVPNVSCDKKIKTNDYDFEDDEFFESDDSDESFEETLEEHCSNITSSYQHSSSGKGMVNLNEDWNFKAR